MTEMDEPLTKQAVRAAYGWGCEADWSVALTLIERAAAAGEHGADQQHRLLSQAPIEKLILPPPVRSISNVSRIGVIEGFAPPGFSEWMIDRALPDLAPSKLIDPDGRAVRTAHSTGFGPPKRDLILAVLQERASRIIHAPIAFHEPPVVISYEPGQEFSMHVDFVNPVIPEFQEELQRLGQRTATFITYLNADFDGAETVFPDIGFKYRGSPGDALVFANVLPDGTPDYKTSHCGLPPTRGRKWVLSQWIRSKPFPYTAKALA